MSLAKAALFVARRQGPYLSRIQRRSVSSLSDSHDEHHGSENVSYPKEGFSSAGWTYTIIATLGIIGFYKFAPSPDEDNYVTRYISYYFTPSSSWASTNDRHLELTTSLREAVQISQTGQRPHIHRYRYPHSLEVASPFSVPVGGDPDVSRVRVKGTNEF
ncbi:hypothetical protein DFH94DRAFT_728985 [Russula ochroleuca]|uniref:Uncharacterized protein n=1 Tax=Russula ochroleuca TaxID=152965 RepID=A0A9P5MZL9_9AGAM|nr:hypothetical protein DFH94DRAFT_728985 [Russula ochroleuca]